MRIRSSFPHPPLQVVTQGPQTVLSRGSRLSLLVVSLMLAFPGTSHAGGAAGGNSAAGTPGTGGGAGAGYGVGGVITSSGANAIVASGTASAGGAPGVAGTAGTATSGGGGGGIGSIQSSLNGLASAVTGGAGGSNAGPAGPGGGGDGLVLSSGGPLISAVTGGAGGNSVSFPGGAGGGAGIVYTASGTNLTITKAVTGGAGGRASGVTGGGGSGVWVTSAGNVSVTAGSVTGGAGGIPTVSTGISGTGGAGVVFSAAGAALDVSGQVSGGNSPGSGGIGGAGVNIISGGSTVTVESGGSIAGGTGGSQPGGALSAANAFAGGAGSGGAPGGIGSGQTNSGGVGIAAAGGGNTIITGGAISGGMAGGIQANAITFSGFAGNNTLKLLSGYSFTGNVAAGLIGTNHLILGGDTSPTASFDVSGIVAPSGPLTANITNYTGFKAFQKTDASTWTLTGSTGAVTPWEVSGGTLSVSSDGALGVTSGALTLDEGGTLQNTATFSSGRAVTANGGTLDTADADLTLTGVVSGEGELIKEGNGTLVLTGANTYSGGTSISGGTLSVSSDGALGAIYGDLTLDGGTLQNTATFTTARNVDLTANGGTLDTVGADLTLSGTVSGPGGLTKEGDGTLILSGLVIPNGITTITQGTVQVGDGGTTGRLLGDVATSTGTTLAFDHNVSSTFSGAMSGAGALSQIGSGTLVLTGENTYTGGTSITQGTLQVGDGTSGSLVGDVATSTGTTLAFDRNDSYTFGGVISGAGALSQIGTATLSLTGDSSAFTGASDVAAGTLEVDGKLGGTLTVDSGAILSGIGTVGTTTLANGAILAPGNSATPVGTLNVNGNLTFAPGSTYQVQIPPGSTASSLVNVSGTANLAGSVVHLGENGNYAGSSTYTILTASQLNGSFDSVSSNLAFLTPSLVYDANDVMLRLQMKENFADAAVTHNQRAVANALQNLPAGSDLYSRILNLPNGAPPAVFNALSGESHASTASVLQGVTDNVIKLPMDHLRSKLDAGDVASPEAEQPVWVQVFGNSRTLGGNSNSAKVEESDGGVFVGADRLIDNGWRVGGALGYTDSHSTVSDRSSKFAIDSYSATVYGGKAFDAGPGKINLTAGAAYTWSDIDSRRDVNAAGLDQTLKSTSGASTGQVFSELGYALSLNNHATIEPFVGAAFSDQRLRGFSESGGSTALDGESKTNDTTTTTLGLHAKTALTALQLQGHLYGTVGLRHAFGDVTPETTMAFEGSQPFTVAGAPIARNAAVTEVGADVAVSKNTTVGVSYSGQFGAGYQQNAGSINANWRF